MSDPTENKSASEKTLLGFFSNPVVGMISAVASILGLILAVYFYAAGKEVPQLTYYVHPIKAVVVRAGQASRLTSAFDGKVIDTDITATQIAVWNTGNRTIKKDNILKPIVIYTQNSAPILEATVRKASREVIHLGLETSELQKGRVGLSWDILEHNDGGVIQLIYAGNPNVSFLVEGVIEGQNQIKELKFGEEIKSPNEQLEAAQSDIKGVGVICFVISGLLLLAKGAGMVGRRKARKQKQPSGATEALETETQSISKIERDISRLKNLERKFDIAMTLTGYLVFLLSIVGGIYFLFGYESGPPFGF